MDRIRSAAYGHTIGKDIGLIYLLLDLAKPGTQVEVEIMGELVKAEVVPTPMVDPEGERIRS